MRSALWLILNEFVGPVHNEDIETMIAALGPAHYNGLNIFPKVHVFVRGLDDTVISQYAHDGLGHRAR